MKKLPFAEKVQRSMKERSLSLRSVCREARLDASFFSKVLAGKRSPPWDEAVLRRLAGVLGLDPLELIVSTGRIPSEWQPLFKDPAVLSALARMSQAQPATRPPSGGVIRTIATTSISRQTAGGLAPAARAFSDELL